MIVYRKVSEAETQVAVLSDKNTVHNKVIMGADEMEVSVVVDSVLPVRSGDYVKLGNVEYTLNRDSEYTVKNQNQFSYDSLIFEHPYYRFIDKILSYKITGSRTFYLTGKLRDFVELIVWCVNVSTENPLGVDTGWTVGDIPDTKFKNLYFDSTNCKDALSQLSTEFDVEFFFNNKEVNFVDRIKVDTSLVFEQGRENGLYEVSQLNVDKEDTTTRVYPIGGNKNVPNAHADFEGNLKLPEDYLENFSDISRVIESTVKFEDVFPHFLGTIDSVSGTNNASFVCNSIDFDLNAIAVKDEATVNFISGDLMGVSFKFSYDNTAKRVTLTPQDDQAAQANPDGTRPQLPGSLRKLKAGDQFNFTGVIMPDSYVQSALTELRSKATSWLAFRSKKRVKYNLRIDHRFMRGKQPLEVGQVITVSIPQSNLSDKIRITELKRNIESGALTATVSNYLNEKWESKFESKVQEVVKDSVENSKQITIVDRTNAERARRNASNIETLRDNIFDPDGYFDPTHIKPASIETMMLSVGSKSQDFSLNDVYIDANYQGDANKLNVTSGSLSHNQLQISGLGYVWTIAAATFSNLVPSTFYYLYARCSKTALNGTWVLSSNKITAEQESGYYHFWTGVLYSIKDGYRDFNAVYGVSSVVGNRITSGKVQSRDGNTIIDLDGGPSKLRGSFTFVSGKDAETEIKNANQAATDVKSQVDNLVIEGANMLSNLPKSWEHGARNASTGGGDVNVAPYSTITIRTKSYLLVSQNAKYTFNITGSKANAAGYAIYYDASDNFIGSSYLDGGSAIVKSMTFTTPANCQRVRFDIYGDSDISNDVKISPSDMGDTVFIKFEKGEDSSSFSYSAGDLREMSQEISGAATQIAELDNMVGGMADDGILNPVEKRNIQTLWAQIQSDYANVISKAAIFQLSTTSLAASYTTLNNVVTPILADLNNPTNPFDSAPFNNALAGYKAEYKVIDTAITQKGKDSVDTVQNNLNTTNQNLATANQSIVNLNSDVTSTKTALENIGADNKFANGEIGILQGRLNVATTSCADTKAQAVTYNISTVSLDSALSALTTTVNGWINSVAGTDITKSIDLTSATMNSTFDAYYSAETVVRKAIVQAAKDAAAEAQATADNIKIGGVNLIDNSKVYSIVGSNQWSFGKLCDLKPLTEYVFSYGYASKRAGDTTTFRLLIYDLVKNIGSNLSADFYVPSPDGVYKFKTPAANAGGTWSIIVYAGIPGSTQGNVIDLAEVKAEEGNKKSSWSLSIFDQQEYADKAADDTRTALRNIASDGKFSYAEIAALKSRVNIAAQDTSDVWLQAAKYGLDDGESRTLWTILNNTTQSWIDAVSGTDITKSIDLTLAQLNKPFNDSYEANRLLRARITQAAKDATIVADNKANQATQALKDIASDGKFSNGEIPQLRARVADVNTSYSNTIAQAQKYNRDYTALTTAKTSLESTANNWISQVAGDDITKFISISLSDLNAPFVSYYNAETAVNSAINDEIKRQTQAVADDLATANQVIANSKKVTDYFSTTVNGPLVTTNSLVVGNALNGAVAGITGISVNGDGTDVRFFAGASLENRASAPYRVLHNGKAVMTDADVTGKITSTEGKISIFNFDSASMWFGDKLNNALNTSSALMSTSTLLFRRKLNTNSQIKEFLFSSDVGEMSIAQGENWACRIQNNYEFKTGSHPTISYRNIGLRLSATGGDINYALDITDGDIRVLGKTGLTVTRGIKVLHNETDNNETGYIERIYEAEWVNGILVRLTYKG